MSGISPARWLPAAQEGPGKRFWYEPLLESGFIPEAVIRVAIRRMLRDRLHEEDQGSDEANRVKLLEFIASMKTSPIALRTESANAQHYEVPAMFFEKVLGPRLKYSSAFYGPDCRGLTEAEEVMLKLTCERAQLADGQKVLELGCGWGSLTLWMAEYYPHSRITGVSNSASQQEFILTRARQHGLANVEILTADMNMFAAPRVYDRVVSVEMFEHMCNWEKLLERVASWMKSDAKFFLHIFTHKRFAYLYEVRGEGDWIAQHFFTGGMMPSDGLLSVFDRHLHITNHWQINGTHYQKTSEDWLRNMDAAKKSLMPLLAETYGAGHAKHWWVRWRIFFLACAELWGYRDGTEWLVSHYLLEKTRNTLV